MSEKRILDTINSPEDIKRLGVPELESLAEEIRQELVQVTSTNGGHLAPNLGVVELTLALHKEFSTPEDKLIFDVGHQSYVHKIITGRREQFRTIRTYGGLSGFPKRSESEHDAFGAGHSSTSISAALGMAVARDLQGRDYHVVAIIGDGSMTGGMAFEALNNAGDLHKRLIVILNDNEMSISKNVGAMSEYLYQLRTGETYNRLKKDVRTFLKEYDFGHEVLHAINKFKGSLKHLVVPNSLFEDLGFTYLGPIDGHNLSSLLEVLQAAKRVNGPVLVHVLTKKGKGYAPAEEHPNKFHGTGPFEIATGRKISDPHAPKTYTEVFGKSLVELANQDEKIVGITAAMPEGTGMSYFAEAHGKRFVDVGIAEQHAVTAAAGMAAVGMKPVVAIYSTFMQRAYDSIVHDICMQNLHVVMCLDRAGLVGDDGYTHHGAMDYAYLRNIPGMLVMAPKDEGELRSMLKTAVNMQCPVSIRYPRGSGLGVDISQPMSEVEELPIGRAEVLREGEQLAVWAIGSMVSTAQEVAAALGGSAATVVNMRFAKPLDEDLLVEHAKKYGYIVTLEEGVLAGGVGSAVLECLNKHGLLQQCAVLNIGLPDKFIVHGSRGQLLKDIGMDVPSIVKKIQEFKK